MTFTFSHTALTECVLLIRIPVSVTSADSFPYSGGPLTEKQHAGLPDIKFLQNLAHHTAESGSGNALLASLPHTF